MIEIGYNTGTDDHVVHSLLDTDFYKFTMGQLIFRKYGRTPVKFGFKNRTRKVPLADIIREEDLRRELDHVRTLSMKTNEIFYLRGVKLFDRQMFGEDYLDFLANLALPDYKLTRRDSTYELAFGGDWAEVTHWEIYALEIVNELYYRALLAKMTPFERIAIYAEGVVRLREKIKTLKEHPEITFCDFGTRRRFSRSWQDFVVRTLSEELSRSQFLGTSNVYLAMKYGLMPMGTSAHELYMIMTGVMHGSDEEIRESQRQVVRDWWDEYGWGLSIALPDTYGTDFYLNQVMTKEDAVRWKGFRHDSGDPIEFGEKVIAFYERHGIEAREKLLVFSDGLDLEAILAIAAHFKGRIKVTFGWGTNLTNDLGLMALSLVVKAAESCGVALAKLSDNIAKATGPKEAIEEMMRVMDYHGTYEKACTY